MLEFFREQERFNARYLWAEKEMIEGNEEVIWGFLDDIYYWHHHKTSPFDPSLSDLRKSTKVVKTARRASHILKSQKKLFAPKPENDENRSRNIQETPRTEKINLPFQGLHNQSVQSHNF